MVHAVECRSGGSPIPCPPRDDNRIRAQAGFDGAVGAAGLDRTSLARPGSPPRAEHHQVCLCLRPTNPVSPNVNVLTAGGDAPVSPEFSASNFWIAWQTGARESAAVDVCARWAYAAL